MSGCLESKKVFLYRCVIYRLVDMSEGQNCARLKKQITVESMKVRKTKGALAPKLAYN